MKSELKDYLDNELPKISKEDLYNLRVKLTPLGV